MRDKIRQFLKNKKQPILLLKHKGNTNPLYEWSKIRNPLRTAFNAFIINICKILPLGMKVSFLRFFLGIKIGKNVGIAPSTEIDPYYPELISIGDNVTIGWKVNILCHEFTQARIRFGRVNIGKNVLIGAFSLIRSGVSIGDNSVIAMDSFVNKDIPPSELWGGVPARRIRKLKEAI